MIHRQFAQRRRLMAGETVKMVTLTLTGSFDNSGLFGERYVAVDGEIITELGTYKVRQGSTIILHTKISPIMGGSEKYGIFVNNKCVRTAANCINHGPDYEYTVTCNCTINGRQALTYIECRYKICIEFRYMEGAHGQDACDPQHGYAAA